MKKKIRSFWVSETGNVVIDWVVLLAGSVMLALSVVVTITAELDTITSDTSDQMSSIDVNSAV